MQETPSDRRLAENEVIFRRLNEQAYAGLTTVNALAHEDGQPEFRVRDDKLLSFYCECSNLSCTKRVRAPFGEYSRIHQTRDTFIVAPGHEVPAIERVVKKEPAYTVVQKYVDPPQQV